MLTGEKKTESRMEFCFTGLLHYRVFPIVRILPAIHGVAMKTAICANGWKLRFFKYFADFFFFLKGEA
jgi:hypothetical protein